MLSFNLLAIFTIKCNDSVDSSQLSLNKLSVQHLMHPNSTMSHFYRNIAYKMESIRKLSNFYFQWTKALYYPKL